MVIPNAQGAQSPRAPRVHDPARDTIDLRGGLRGLNVERRTNGRRTKRWTRDYIRHSSRILSRAHTSLSRPCTPMLLETQMYSPVHRLRSSALPSMIVSPHVHSPIVTDRPSSSCRRRPLGFTRCDQPQDPTCRHLPQPRPPVHFPSIPHRSKKQLSSRQARRGSLHRKGVEPLPRRWQRRMIPFHQRCPRVGDQRRHSLGVGLGDTEGKRQNKSPDRTAPLVLRYIVRESNPCRVESSGNDA